MSNRLYCKIYFILKIFLLNYSLKLYYASLWFALILIGVIHGLVFLPVALCQFGGSGYSTSTGEDEAEVGRRLQRAQDSAEFRPFAADVEAEDIEDEYY